MQSLRVNIILTLFSRLMHLLAAKPILHVAPVNRISQVTDQSCHHTWSLLLSNERTFPGAQFQIAWIS